MNWLTNLFSGKEKAAPPKKLPCSNLFCPQQFSSEKERDEHYNKSHHG